MTKKLQNTISLTLVLIFLTPMTIKLLDGLFHHHEHFHCTVKNEKHFYKYHEKCPIPGFELSFFSKEERLQTTQKNDFCSEINYIYKFIYCCTSSKYSFLLRAPPIFTVRIMSS